MNKTKNSKSESVSDERNKLDTRLQTPKHKVNVGNGRDRSLQPNNCLQNNRQVCTAIHNSFVKLLNQDRPLILILIALLVIAQNSAQVFAVYGNGNWAYRKAIPITGSPGAWTNYQVKILVGESSGTGGTNVNVDGHSLSAFDDVRFTDNDGNTELSYWRESVTGSTPDRIGTFWVKVTDNLNTNQSIYIYYGNASATSASNGTNTFLFFDNFSGDLSNWTNNIGASASIVSGELRITYGSTSSTLNDIYTTQTFNPQNTRIDFKTAQDRTTNYIDFVGWRGDGTTSNVYYMYYKVLTPSEVAIGGAVGGVAATFNAVARSYSNNVRFPASLYISGNTWNFVDSTGTVTATDVKYSQLTTANIGISRWSDDGYSYWDDIRLRKYASPEPATGAPGSEEELISPGAITDLVAVTDAQVKLTWTAPGDDSYIGDLNGSFEIKYSSNSTDTPSTAVNSILISVTTSPGVMQNRIVTGLYPRTTYYFWIRTKDDANNWSVWSDTASAISGTFIDINAGLVGVGTNQCSLAWGDYDNDGDLDLALAGYSLSRVSKIYRNDNGSFTDINAGLTGVGYASLAWVDYDNDGDLDLALAGDTGAGYVSKIYRNDSGSFADINAGLIGVIYGNSLVWGDYDNDGDLDLALAGESTSGRVSRIYRNDSSSFTDINAGLIAVNWASLSWGDYDNDGDLDLALTGLDSSLVKVSKIYRNDGGSFTDINAGLTGVWYSSLAWGDYDNDGDLDLALAGENTSGTVSRIYRNDSGSFTDINAGLTGVFECALAWGDYDNDGDLDLALAGYSGTGPTQRISKIYRNAGSSFTPINTGFVEVGGWRPSLAWGDYDNDGDLDLALAGFSANVSKIYRSEQQQIFANTPPLAPSGGFSFSYSTATAKLELRWNSGNDSETTQQQGLYYIVRVSTITPINDSNAKIISWRSATPFLGNYPHGFVANGQPGVKLLLPMDKIYYWQVRTIDTGLRCSSWSTEQTTDLAPSGAITDLVATVGTNEGEIKLNWSAVGDDGYSGNIANGKWRIAYSTDSSFNFNINNYQIELTTNTTPGQNQYYTLTGLTNGTTYYFRIWTADEVPNWSLTSNGATTYAMTDIVNPGTITDLVSSGTAVEGEVRLNWTAVGDNGYNGSSHHYQLRYTTNDGINWTTDWNSATVWNDNLAVSGAVGTAESTVINGLTKETTYYFGIKSDDEAGNTSAVSSVSGYVRDLTSPNAINNLTAVSNGYGGQIELSWTSPGDDGGSGNITNGKWRIAYSSVSVSDSVSNYNIELTTNTTPGQNQSYTVTGLSGGTTYYFRIWAGDNETNWSANSNSASALTDVVRRLVFISPAVVVSAGNYSLSVSTVQIQDENNNPINISGFTTLVLETTSGQGKFSLDKITPINEVTINPGNNSFSFYYYDETVGNPTMTIKHKTLNWYNGSQAASVVSGGVIRFQVDCPNSGDVAIARSVTITALDVYNNIVSTYSGTVNLRSDKNIILPASLDFTAGDNGQKTLPVIDNYVEQAKIIAEESANPAIWGESGILDWYGVQVVATNLAPANVRQGEQDVGMEKLIVATSSGSCVFKGIRLKKSGTSIADNDVSLAKIYRDTGNGLFETVSDLLLSSGVFSSGSCDLGGMNETINETPKIYYLIYDFANSANRGKTVGAEIAYASNLTVEGRRVGINNFPITSQNAAIESAQLVMDLKVESKIKTPIMQGSQNVVVERYTVWSDNGSAGWQKMGLSLIGSGSDKDVGSVKLYKKNSFGTVTLDSDGGVQTVFVSSGIFSSGALTLNFNPVETIDSTTQYYYLTYDISGEATVGATVGASGNATNFDLGGVDKVAETNLPYSSDLATINPTIDTVTVSGLDLLSVQIKQGSKNRAFAKLNLKTSANSAVLKSIKVKKLGTLSDSGIPAAKIYKEDTSANEWLDIGGGTTAPVKLVSGGTDLFNSGEAGINLVSGEVINPAGKNFYIVIELSESATVGGSIGIRIEQAGIGVDSPDLVAGTNLPLETKQAQISDNPDTLTVTGLDLLGTGRSVVQGRETAVLKLYLSVDHDKATMSKIKLKKLGDCPDTDIQTIKIVADANNNGDYDSGDRSASSGSDVFSSGIVVVNLSPAEDIPQGTTTVCFVVLGMNQSAQPGKTVGIEINDNGYIELTLPDLVDTNGFPITSSIATIKDIRTPTTPIVVDGGLYTAIEDSLQARWTSAVGEGSIAESWYAIGTIPGATNLVNWTTAGNSRELTRIDLSLENGKTYYLAVKVKNSLGDYWSDIGVSDGITTDFIKPQLQEIPKITRVVSKGTLNDVVIKWPVADAGVSGIVKYEIQQREAKSPLWTTVKIVELVGAGFIQPEIRGLNISATSLTYLVEGVLSGTYFYRVRAENGAGVWSDWAEMPSPVIAGDLPSELISEVSNYPNPFDSRKRSTIINFTLNQQSQVKIKIYDLFGYLVRELSAEGSAGSANNIEWDGTDADGRKVSQGMYLAVIEATADNGDKGKVTRRIGVIH